MNVPDGNIAMNSGGNKAIYHLGAVLCMVAWGSSFVMTKILLEHGLGPAEAYVYRVALAWVLMLLISHRRLWARTLKDEGLFVVGGMCSGSIYFMTENTALQYTLVSNVSLITTLSPLLTMLLIGLIYKNEKPRPLVLVGSFVALLGVAMVIFNSSLDVSINPLGDFLALGAALSWSVYSIVLRNLTPTYDLLFITRKMFFYGLITTLPFMARSGLELSVLAQPVVWGNLIALGIFCSVIAFLIWGVAVKKLGAVTASNYLYFQPVVTMIVSAIVIHEAVSAVGYCGCALILIGVVLSDRIGARK